VTLIFPSLGSATAASYDKGNNTAAKSCASSHRTPARVRASSACFLSLERR
jgi:hypothetical protein